MLSTYDVHGTVDKLGRLGAKAEQAGRTGICSKNVQRC